MDLSIMRARLRRDLQDEGSPSTFSDNELDRAIARAVTELSKYLPYQMLSTIETVSDSDEIDISSLSDVISIDRVEFPVGNTPRTYARFEVYGDTIRFLVTLGDGNDCYVYWSAQHKLDAAGSTLPAYTEDLVALGASAYAVMSLSQAKVDTNNTGGTPVADNYQQWALNRLKEFENGLKKLRSNINRLRTSQLYPAD